MKAAIGATAERNAELLRRSAPFSAHINDSRLSLEVAVIQRFAEDLNRRLLVRDPLSERVHHNKSEQAILILWVLGRFLGRRLGLTSVP